VKLWFWVVGESKVAVRRDDANMANLNHRKDGPNAEVGALHDSMAGIISRWVTEEADFSTPIPNLNFFRRDAPSQPDFCLIEPSVVLVVQGEKKIAIGGEEYPYDTSHFLITSLDLPATSQVVSASPEVPCLGFALKLDLRMLAELVAQGSVPPPKERAAASSIGLGAVSTDILEPFNRLLKLMDEPESIGVLAPLIEREMCS